MTAAGAPSSSMGRTLCAWALASGCWLLALVLPSWWPSSVFIALALLATGPLIATRLVPARWWFWGALGVACPLLAGLADALSHDVHRGVSISDTLALFAAAWGGAGLGRLLGATPASGPEDDSRQESAEDLARGVQRRWIAGSLAGGCCSTAWIVGFWLGSEDVRGAALILGPFVGTFSATILEPRLASRWVLLGFLSLPLQVVAFLLAWTNMRNVGEGEGLASAGWVFSLMPMWLSYFGAGSALLGRWLLPATKRLVEALAPDMSASEDGWGRAARTCLAALLSAGLWPFLESPGSRQQAIGLLIIPLGLAIGPLLASALEPRRKWQWAVLGFLAPLVADLVGITSPSHRAGGGDTIHMRAVTTVMFGVVACPLAALVGAALGHGARRRLLPWAKRGVRS